MIRRWQGDLFCSLCQPGIGLRPDICSVCDLFVTAVGEWVALQPIEVEATPPRCC